MSRNWLWNTVDLGCRGESDYCIDAIPEQGQAVVASEDMIIRDACFGWRYTLELGEKVLPTPPVDATNPDQLTQEEKERIVYEAGIDFSNYGMAEFEITVSDKRRDIVLFGGRSNKAMLKLDGVNDHQEFGSSSLEDDQVKEIKFSPEGNMVCVTFLNTGPKIWMIIDENGSFKTKRLLEIQGIEANLPKELWVGCTWSIDQKRLALVSQNSMVALIEIRDYGQNSTPFLLAAGRPNKPHTHLNSDSPIPSKQQLVDFSHDGKHLYLGGDKCIWMHSLASLPSSFSPLSTWERSRHFLHEHPIVFCKLITKHHLLSCNHKQDYETEAPPHTTLKIFNLEKRLLVYESDFEGEISRVRLHRPMWSVLFNNGVLHMGLMLLDGEQRGLVSWEDAKEQEELMAIEEARALAEQQAAEEERIRKLEEQKALDELDEVEGAGEARDVPNGTKSLGKGDSGTASMRKDGKAKEQGPEHGSGSKKPLKKDRNRKNKDNLLVKEGGEESKREEGNIGEPKAVNSQNLDVDNLLDLDQLITAVGVSAENENSMGVSDNTPSRPPRSKSAMKPDPLDPKQIVVPAGIASPDSEALLSLAPVTTLTSSGVFTVQREKRPKKKAQLQEDNEESMSMLGKRAELPKEDIELICQKMISQALSEAQELKINNFCLGVTGKLGYTGKSSTIDVTNTSGYLCWNSIGKAISKTEMYLNQHPLDIEFEHGAKTIFPVPHKYNAAEINESGILLGSLKCMSTKDPSFKPPHVMFIASNKGKSLVPKSWSHNFPKSTELVAMTMGSHFVALATSKPNEMHLMSMNGELFVSIAAPGDIISLNHHREALLIVYQVAQQQRLRVMNVMLMEILIDTEVPVDRSGNLMWFGVASDHGRSQQAIVNDGASIQNSTGSSDQPNSKALPETDSNASNHNGNGAKPAANDAGSLPKTQEVEQILWILDNGRVWSLSKQSIWISKGTLPPHQWVLGAQIVHSHDKVSSSLEIHTLDLINTSNRQEPLLCKQPKPDENPMIPPEERRTLLVGLHPGFSDKSYLQEAWMVAINRDQTFLSNDCWSNSAATRLPPVRRAKDSTEADKSRIKYFRQCLVEQKFEDAIAIANTIDSYNYFKVCFKIAKQQKLPQDIYSRIKDICHRFGNHRYFKETSPQRSATPLRASQPQPPISNNLQPEESHPQSKDLPQKSTIKDEKPEETPRPAFDTQKSERLDLAALPSSISVQQPPGTLSAFFKPMEVRKLESPPMSSIAPAEPDSLANSSALGESPHKKVAKTKDKKGKQNAADAHAHKKNPLSQGEPEKERSSSARRNEEAPPRTQPKKDIEIRSQINDELPSKPSKQSHSEAQPQKQPKITDPFLLNTFPSLSDAHSPTNPSLQSESSRRKPTGHIATGCHQQQAHPQQQQKITFGTQRPSKSPAPAPQQPQAQALQTARAPVAPDRPSTCRPPQSKPPGLPVPKPMTLALNRKSAATDFGKLHWGAERIGTRSESHKKKNAHDRGRRRRDRNANEAPSQV